MKEPHDAPTAFLVGLAFGVLLGAALVFAFVPGCLS